MNWEESDSLELIEAVQTVQFEIDHAGHWILIVVIKGKIERFFIIHSHQIKTYYSF